MDAVTLKLAKKYADAVLGSSAGIEMRVDAGNVEWRQAGGAWAILIPVTDLMGPGVPVGGSTGQALVKSSAADGDTEWATPFDGDYGSLTNKPTLGTAAAEDVGAFAAAAHTHAIADATDVDTTGITLGQTLVWDGSEFTPGSSGAGDMLKSVYDSVDNGIVNEARAVAWSGVSGKPSDYPPSSHSHPVSDVTNLQTLLDAKADDVAGAGTRALTFTGGTQDSGGVIVDAAATASTIPLRGPGGVVNVGPPTDNTHAATKKYVDDTVSNAGGGDMLKSTYDSVGDGVVNEARAVAWSGVSGKPGTFTPSSHSHNMGDITGLTGALSGKADVSHTHAASDIASGTLGVARGGTGASTFASGSFLQGNGTGAVTTRTPGQVLSDIGAAAASHSHPISDVTNLQSALNAKQDSATAFDGAYSSLSGIPSTFAPAAHNHDDRYYTESEADNLLGGKANTSHTHAAGDITSGTFAIGRIPTGSTGSTVALGNHDHSGVYAPVSHTHAAGDVTSGTFADARIPNLNTSKLTAGTLGVARGGTGASTLASGSFLQGNGTSAVQLRTPAQVKSDIDAMDKHFTVSAQTGASYTLVLANDGQLVTMNNANANTLTVPSNSSVAFPVGTVINFAQIGAGTTTVTAASGVTMNGVVAGSAAVEKRYSIGSLVKTATNTWLLSGPMADVS